MIAHTYEIVVIIINIQEAVMNTHQLYLILSFKLLILSQTAVLFIYKVADYNYQMVLEE